MGERSDGFGELRRAAERSAELAREHAPATESDRALPGELVGSLRDGELFRAGVPRRLGGPEAPPEVILGCAETVARGDASAGWCVSIGATSSMLAAYLPKDGAEEVFGEPGSVAAGVWAPTGRARAVAGGLQVSGRWSFCSGINHSDWLFAGCMVDPGNGPPVNRVVAIPKADLDVRDTWYTGGLRGTGSHDSVAEAVLVPERRILALGEGPQVDEPLYRFPIFGFFALSIAAAALGNARGAIDDLTALAGEKRSLGSSRSLAERSSVQAAVAEAEAALRAARLLFFQAVADAWQAAQATRPVPDAARVGLRLAATHATRTSAEVTRSMHDLGGGAAIYERSPLQRRFRDAHTATAHFQVNPATYELAGRLLLGLPTRTDQL